MAVLNRANSTWWYCKRYDGDECGYAAAAYLVEEPPAFASSVPDGGGHDWQEEEYYGAYAHLKIHLEMLSDDARTEAYQTALLQPAARNLIKDAVVIDVGCGTGILSLFAAQAGARAVHAVEASDMAIKTRRIVSENGFDDVITVHNVRAEELVLPEPTPRETAETTTRTTTTTTTTTTVMASNASTAATPATEAAEPAEGAQQPAADVIVSEWMGTMLVFEYMLESVLHVRDRWLKPNGVIWPSCAALFLAPVSAGDVYEDRVGRWRNMYGVTMASVIDDAVKAFFGRPIHDYDLPEKDLLAPGARVVALEMNSITVEDLEELKGEFKFIVAKTGNMHGFGSWFDAEFARCPPMTEARSAAAAPGAPAEAHSKEDNSTPAKAHSKEDNSGTTDQDKEEHMADESTTNLLAAPSSASTSTGAAVTVLRTGPSAPQTHWKQDLLMLDDPLQVMKGDHVAGCVILRRHPEMRRHLRVSISFNVEAADPNPNRQLPLQVSKEWALWR